MKKFDYYRPQDLREAFRLMSQFGDRARYIAGGTDIIVRMKQKTVQPDALVSLRGIKALTGFTHNGGLSLGSMTLLRDIEREPVIARDYPILVESARMLANPQVRNVATIGGNLCNAAPSADCAPPLLVMEARMILEGPDRMREIAADRFFTGPGETCMDRTEVLKSIHIPKMRNRTGAAFFKTGRVTQDIAIVNAAALLVMEGKLCRKCRLSVGAVAPTPLRLEKAEKLVEGEQIDPDLLDRVEDLVRETVKPITDVRSTADYRRALSGVLVKRAIQKTLSSL
ncbi:MAG: xanthine dehydrogenase family protein subunit M [Deltaproteobacteria bacterium]|nr:xanthine dehydrogenase family protein subunit M [Deltaproteobacteria bacterium]